jgi:hypothetical protein
MEKDFMKLLKTYIDKMQELWKAGKSYEIHTLATAIADMTKYSDMIDLVAGHPNFHKDIEILSHAAELIIEDEKKNK